jgi:hypothetical protein
MDPPQDLLNPWDIARKKKKQKTPNIGRFFKKKNEAQVREEREAADARAAAAQADATTFRLKYFCCWARPRMQWTALLLDFVSRDTCGPNQGN